MDLEALKKAKFKVFDTVLHITVEEYQASKTIALQLVDELDDYYCMLSVNIPESKMLPPDHVFIKNWSENEKVAEAAFATGLFEDTGKKAQSGYVQAPLWRIL